MLQNKKTMSSCHTEEFRGTMFCICNLISNNNEWGFQWVWEGTLGLSQKACIEFSEILSPLIWFSVSLIVFSVFFVTNTLKFLFRKKKDKIYCDQKKKKKISKTPLGQFSGYTFKGKTQRLNSLKTQIKK